jgi:CBS domain containing-hemolysin-like protein
MTLLILFIALALGFSFLCSIMEAVLLSVTPQYVARVERSGKGRFGKRLRALRDDVDRPLAAILSLNTIAHTVGAAGAGAQAAAVFGDVYVGLISAALTFLILVFSEIIPKTLGAVHWRGLAPIVVRLIIPTIWVMWPLVKLADGLTALLASGKRGVLVHRDEFIALAEAGPEEGFLHEEESRILKNLLRFRQVRARDIMTPRTVVFALPETMSVSEALETHPDIHFSRIPIHSRNLDHVTGFVLKSDLLLRAVQRRGDSPLVELRRPIDVVPGEMPLHTLFDHFLDERVHIAMVVDEYGGMQGLATLEDLIETLLGLEIVDEADATQDMQELARREWRKRAKRMGIVTEEDEGESDR